MVTGKEAGEVPARARGNGVKKFYTQVLHHPRASSARRFTGGVKKFYSCKKTCREGAPGPTYSLNPPAKSITHTVPKRGWGPYRSWSQALKHQLSPLHNTAAPPAPPHSGNRSAVSFQGDSSPSRLNTSPMVSPLGSFFFLMVTTKLFTPS